MIRDGETGFCIQPFDKITFAKAIKTLLKMKADGSLGQMQEAARAFALEQYSPKAVANKYLEVYRS
jgi:glycosyltransferase involved in cell wall biosynthesis